MRGGAGRPTIRSVHPTAAGHRSPSPELLITLVLSAAGLLVYVVAASAGWPGSPSGCLAAINCYCEEPIAGMARQPANTWSNLAALIVAAFVASDASRLRRGEVPWFADRPARSPGQLPALGLFYALVIVFQGLGSMFFHGSLTEWGARLDAVSVFAVAALLLVSNLGRLGILDWRGKLAVFAALCAAGVVYRLYVRTATAPPVSLLVLVIVATELVGQRARRVAGLGSGWAVASYGVFFAGASLWALSFSKGFPLCAPSSRLQAYALWHLTSAAAVGIAWINARNDHLERPALCRDQGSA